MSTHENQADRHHRPAVLRADARHGHSQVASLAEVPASDSPLTASASRNSSLRRWTEFLPPDRTSSTYPTAKPGLVIEDNDEFAHNLGPDTRSWSPVWVQLLSSQG